MIAADLAGVALVIAAVSTLVTSVAAAIVTVLTFKRAGAIQHEVKTMNELTIGQLGEASETRRITQIPADERTSREKRHLAGDTLRGDPEP